MRLAVISPFLDKRHGTERVILEQIERFRRNRDAEIHIYSQRIEDLSDISIFQGGHEEKSGSVLWHRIPSFPGPHLFGYIWWFLANHFYRWWDSRKLRYDLVYSPGVNAFDADVIAVHIVFHEFYRRIKPHISLKNRRLRDWPVLIHRHLYYRLIMALERRVYQRKQTRIIAISNLVSRHLQEFFSRSDSDVVPNAVDTNRFTPAVRAERRVYARNFLQLSADQFALLMIGNDWAKKGLEALLSCLSDCVGLPLRLFVVGHDDQTIFTPMIERLGLRQCVHFHPPTSEIENFYAAADLYVSPSLEDSFALPPLEAMACGLPVITSVNNGGAQAITDSVDGFVLDNPKDVSALSGLVRRLYEDSELQSYIGQNAARTAKSYSWDRNAEQTWDILMAAACQKNGALLSHK